MKGCRACDLLRAQEALGECQHPPALVVDEERSGGCSRYTARVCVACGLAYDRSEVLVRLRATIRERHRLPPSPWTAEERSADPS